MNGVNQGSRFQSAVPPIKLGKRKHDEFWPVLLV